jgi:hypothetical protein
MRISSVIGIIVVGGLGCGLALIGLSGKPVQVPPASALDAAPATLPYGDQPSDLFTGVEQGPGTEERRETWPDGSLKAQGFAAVGPDGPVWEGPFRSWHDNGNLASEGHWQAGQRHGAWHFWHPNGQQRLEGFYVGDQLDRSRFWVERDVDGGWVDGHASAARAAGERLASGGAL